MSEYWGYYAINSSDIVKYGIFYSHIESKTNNLLSSNQGQKINSLPQERMAETG